jgi:hypothetical protein
MYDIITIASISILVASTAIYLHEYECNRFLAGKAKREQKWKEMMQKIKEDSEKMHRNESFGFGKFDVETYLKSGTRLEDAFIRNR